MALIIEDGSLVAGAESYVSAGDARAYALKRGITLSADDADIEVALVKSMDYLESFANYKGQKVETTQALSWPRQWVIIDTMFLTGSWFSEWDTWGGLVAGDFFPSDQIPPHLISAQCQLAIEVNNGVDLMPTILGGPFLTMDKVDVIESRFSDRFGN